MILFSDGQYSPADALDLTPGAIIRLSKANDDAPCEYEGFIDDSHYFRQNGVSRILGAEDIEYRLSQGLIWSKRVSNNHVKEYVIDAKVEQLAKKLLLAMVQNNSVKSTEQMVYDSIRAAKIFYQELSK